MAQLRIGGSTGDGSFQQKRKQPCPPSTPPPAKRMPSAPPVATAPPTPAPHVIDLLADPQWPGYGPAVVAAPTAAAATAAAFIEPVAGPVADPAASGIPGWATFERDAHRWYTWLQEEGCDDRAIADVMLLAQYSDEGFKEANGVIAKLVKKSCDGHEVACSQY